VFLRLHGVEASAGVRQLVAPLSIKVRDLVIVVIKSQLGFVLSAVLGGSVLPVLPTTAKWPVEVILNSWNGMYDYSNNISTIISR
jgi:hypothetical protein